MGPDKDMIVDFDGNIIESLSVTDNCMVYIDPFSKEPSAEDPIRFHFLIEADGYVATTKNVVITQEGPSFYEVDMFQIADPGDGVVVYEIKEEEVSNGIIVEDTEIKTDQEEVVLEISQGTQLLTKEGEPLEGELTVEIVFFDPQEEGIEDALPGGIEPTVTQPDGTVEDGSFVSVSFASIEITDEQGRSAEKFTEDIAMQLAIPEGTVNPETGEEIQAGDVVPLWSYDEDTGIWNWEDDVVVTPDLKSGGKLVAKSKINHLTWWNLDFYWSSCRYGIWVDILGRTKCDPCLYFGLEIMQNGTIIRRKVGRICDDIVKFYLAPMGMQANLVAYKNYWDWYYQRNEIGRTLIQDLCDQVTYPNENTANRTTISVSLPGNDFHKVFNFIGTCQDNPNVEIKPSIPVYYKSSESAQYQYLGWVRNGEIEVCNLPVPADYWVRTTYRGQTFEGKISVDANYNVTSDNPDAWGVSVTQSGDNVIYSIALDEETCALF